MNIKEFLVHLNSGKTVTGGSEAHQCMHVLSQEALRLTAKLNSSYHAPEDLREIFSELIEKKVDESFNLFPPFYTDCGKNISIGKNVFFNSGCRFQDQGGITIGDNVLVGHNVVMATLNHDIDPDCRADMHPAPIHIGNKVWLGSNATILPGVPAKVIKKYSGKFQEKRALMTGPLFVSTIYINSIYLLQLFYRIIYGVKQFIISLTCRYIRIVIFDGLCCSK